MNRLSPRLVLLGCAALAAALAAGAVTPALADPAAPGPVPAPYPNVSSRDAATGLPTGKRMHKPYTVAATPDAVAASDGEVIEVQSISWGNIEGAGTVNSADPMEGGQIAAPRYRPGRQKPGRISAVNVASDPEEGGQIAAPANAMNAVPVTSDEQPQAASARVSATFTTLAGKLARGRHLQKVKIVARSGSYTLHDAIVTDVTPAGDGMETVSVSYAGRDE